MDRRVAKTKEAIRNAYFDLMREKDGCRITITEIAKRANIDRKTFYLHYESVDDIMKEICSEKIEELKERLEKSGFYREPIRMDYLVASLHQMLENDLELYSKLAENTNFTEFWKNIRQLAEDSLVEVYEPAVNISREELIVYARFFTAGILSIYLDWLNGDKELDLELVGASIVKIAKEGVLGIFI